VEELPSPPLPVYSYERVIEDYEPPAHAVQPIKGHSLLASLREEIITLAYGRERVFQAPTHLITDSRGRLIVSDPSQSVVHVLEPKGRGSFRIVGGPGLRLQSPTSVAVDADDNIYVADGARGSISVYDPEGRFLHNIKGFHREGIFQLPLAIAIDRTAARLYVVDGPLNELVMLDLQGNVLRRVGGERDQQSDVKIEYPAELTLRNGKLLVLDGAGSRIQVFDLECKWISSFDLHHLLGPPSLRQIGLAMDSTGNIYVSNMLGSVIRVYSPDGRFLTMLGHFGNDVDGLRVPAGMWIDTEDHAFVADASGRRVVVFEVINTKGQPQISTDSLTPASSN
jgi:DNA-binding beta-propeller fold protein YncE